MKAWRVIKRALWEIFDFFCGDWANLIGLAITAGLLAVINGADGLSWARPAGFVLYPVLLGLTLVVAIRRAARNAASSEPGASTLE